MTRHETLVPAAITPSGYLFRQFQFRWPLSATYRAIQRHMSQHLIGKDTAQQKSTATHVSASDEFVRKMQPAAKDGEQMIHIFSRGNASE
jgi:flagellum-specific peptidoglycan hydrolase FlgJ